MKGITKEMVDRATDIIKNAIADGNFPKDYCILIGDKIGAMPVRIESRNYHGNLPLDPDSSFYATRIENPVGFKTTAELRIEAIEIITKQITDNENIIDVLRKKRSEIINGNDYK